MVFWDNRKFACQTCIKGHRSSGCQHMDRPLYEIKKKGRPVTQCEHCRELRKTKQVHIRCQCGDAKEDYGSATGATTNKKGRTSTSLVPTFPNGLQSQDPIGPDLPVTKSCGCHSNEECKCWSIRNSVKPKRSMPPSLSVAPSRSQAGMVIGGVPTSHIEQTNAALAQSSPRNTTTDRHDYPNLNDPSLQMDFHTDSEALHQIPYKSLILPGSPFSLQLDPRQWFDPAFQRDAQQKSSHINDYSPWESPVAVAGFQSPSIMIPEACGCGVACACPGCSEHNGSDGILAPSIFCTAGCATGQGCSNSINAATNDLHLQQFISQTPYEDPTRSFSANTSTYLSHKESYQTFSSVATSNSTLSSQSQLSSPQANNYPLHQGQTLDEPRRTSFATSGERESCCSGDSRTSDHYHHHLSAPSDSSYQQLPALNHTSGSFSSLPPTQQQQQQQQQQQHHSPGIHPENLGGSPTTPATVPRKHPPDSRSHDHQPVSRSATVKRGFKRLLPRPTLEVESVLVDGIYPHTQGQSQLPVTADTKSKDYQHVVSLARAPPTMPFNRFM